MPGIGIGLPFTLRTLRDDAPEPAVLDLLRSAKVWVETDEGAYWSGDDFTITANAFPTPDVYDSVANKGTLGGTFANTGTARPSLAHVVGGGEARRVGLFDGSNDVFVSSLTADNFQYLHTGDFDITLVVRLLESATGDLVATCDNLNETGLRIHQDGSDQIQVDVCNGTGTAYLSATTAAALTLGALYRLRVTRSGSTLTVTAYDYTGAAETTGSDSSTAGAAPTGDPAKTLTVGGASQINFGACCSHASALSAAQWALLEGYTADRYTDADWALAMLYARFLYLPAGSGVTGTVETTAGAVTVAYDMSGHAKDLYSVTGVTEDDSGDWTCAAGAATGLVSAGLGHTGQVHHLFASIQPFSTGRFYLFDATAGRLILAANGELYDGAWRLSGAAVGSLDAQLLEIEHAAAGCESLRDGVSIDTDSTAARNIGGTVRLLSHNNGAATQYQGKILGGGIGLMSSIVTGADLTALRARLHGASARTVDAGSDPDVIVLSGQSNARGNSFVLSGVDPQYGSFPRWDIGAWFDLATDGSPGAPYESTVLEPLGPPGRTNLRNVGTELTMLADIKDAGTDCVLAKSCKGGTGIDAWDKSTGSEYAPLIACAEDAITASGGHAAALVWIHGEADAAVEAAANAYATNLTQLIADVRSDLGVADLPVYVVALRSAHTGTHTSTVRAAQASVAAADDNVHYVETDADGGDPAIELGVDDTHYTEEGYQLLGKRIAAAILEAD